MDILFFYVIPLLAGKAFTLAVLFWGFMIIMNYMAGNARLSLDSDGIYRRTYTSLFANKIALVTFVIMVLSWIPLFSVLVFDL